MLQWRVISVFETDAIWSASVESVHKHEEMKLESIEWALRRWQSVFDAH